MRTWLIFGENRKATLKFPTRVILQQSIKVAGLSRRAFIPIIIKWLPHVHKLSQISFILTISIPPDPGGQFVEDLLKYLQYLQYLKMMNCKGRLPQTFMLLYHNLSCWQIRWYALCLHRTNCTHEMIWIWL